MSGKELEPRRRALPAKLRNAVFVDWYAGRCGVNFDIYAGNPPDYDTAKLEGIKHIRGLESAVLNTKTRSGELVIVGQLAATYQHKAPRIEQVLSKIAELLDTSLRYIAYVPGDGMQEFTLKEWARIRDDR